MLSATVKHACSVAAIVALTLGCEAESRTHTQDVHERSETIKTLYRDYKKAFPKHPTLRLAG